MAGDFRQELHDHLALTSLGGAGFEENYVLVLGPVVPSHLFERAERFFGREEYSIVIESGTAVELEEFLHRRQWRIDEDVPSMLLAPIPDPPTPIAELRVHAVCTEATYEDFMRVSQTGRRWVPSLEAATDPDVCLLVGYVRREPVATSRISCLGEVGEIYGVVTDPDYRRKGYGTQMTWAAIAAGVVRGCSAIVLTATEDGYPVYKKMGFETVCSYRTYVSPARHAKATSEAQERAQKDS